MTNPVFRIDSFAVPAAAMADFQAQVSQTLAVLRTQPGFVRDQAFERISGPGRFNIVTMVEWQDEASQAPAIAAVQALHRQLGIDPTTHSRLGIEDSKANYVPLTLSPAA